MSRRSRGRLEQKTGRIPLDAGAFAARLSQIVAREKSREAFARKVGVSSPALRKWLDGTSQPSRHHLIAAARAAGVTVEWLATGRGHPEHVLEARTAGISPTAKRRSKHDYVLVSKISAHVRPSVVGKPYQVYDDIAFRADWLRKGLGFDPLRLMVLEVSAGGENMGLVEGDMVLIDTGDTDLSDNALYALKIGEEIVVRRIYRKVDGTLVISGGQIGNVEEIVPCAVSRHQVAGRVVWYCRRV